MNTLPDKIIAFLIAPVASLGFMIILLRDIFQPALSDFGEKILDVVSLVAVLAIATVGCWFMFRMTGNSAFVKLVLPLIVLIVLFVGLKSPLQSLYHRKYGKPTSENFWLCRKCGVNNENVYLECQRCHSAKP